MLNPDFEKYAKGFDKVYKEHFGRLPIMEILVFTGWLNIKDKKNVDFYKLGKEHAVRMIKEQNQ